MISGGDEMGRTQHGNNNAYCQDNEISWTDWDLTASQRDFLELRQAPDPHPQGSRRAAPPEVLSGPPHSRQGCPRHHLARRRRGSEMADDTWNSPGVRCLGVRLNGDAINEIDERGERIVGATLVMLLNAGVEAIPFLLPATTAAERWETLLDTADPWQPPRMLRGRERYQLQPRSMAVLRLEGQQARRGVGTDGGRLMKVRILNAEG